MVALPTRSASSATAVLLFLWHTSSSLAFLHRPPSNLNVGIQTSQHSLITRSRHRHPPDGDDAPSRPPSLRHLAIPQHLIDVVSSQPPPSHQLLLHQHSSLFLSFANQFNDKLLQLSSMDPTTAEQLAGPFFGASLFPYLGFLFFLNVPQNETPRGVTVGFATCLLFVFLTIPAAILAKIWYGVSLADCDWLHGSAESLLTITNLVTVVAFRQALTYHEKDKAWQQRRQRKNNNDNDESRNDDDDSPTIPESYVSYEPMIRLVGLLTVVALITALIPAVMGDTTQVHTPYLGGFMDLPSHWMTESTNEAVASSSPPLLILQPHPEPENALTIATWIIHISSLVEFLVAMGFCWRWADISNNPRWKGLTWGLIPLHSSGITACTYHLLYNSIPILVPLQALLTFLGNSTAMYATYRIAVSNGWDSPWKAGGIPFLNILEANMNDDDDDDNVINVGKEADSQSLIGFEDLGDALAEDDDYSFILKLFAGCAIAR